MYSYDTRVYPTAQAVQAFTKKFLVDPFHVHDRQELFGQSLNALAFLDQLEDRSVVHDAAHGESPNVWRSHRDSYWLVSVFV